MHLKTNLLLGLCLITQISPAQELKTLFSIGLPDEDFVEFALAPDQYDQYRADPLFLVGRSDPSLEWPYVLPGPNDQWAGGHEHTASLVFELERREATGGRQGAKLMVDFVDMHGSGPPMLEIDINGIRYREQLPHGAGDVSIMGSPEKGKPFQMVLEFPDSLLIDGTNLIKLANVKGSWCLFDAIRLQTNTNWSLQDMDQFLALTNLVIEKGLIEHNNSLFQQINVQFLYSGEPQSATLLAIENDPIPIELRNGQNNFSLLVEQPEHGPQSVALSLTGETGIIWQKTVEINPITKRTIYILPHSHTDIGYTEVQTHIEDKQVQNLVTGMAEAKRTWGYPEGSKFVWNVEVGWAADLYLQRMNENQRADFVEAVKEGQVSLNGLYLNELTGLCRPEELLRLFAFAKEMESLSGVSIDAAMISDVPGYTWGTVTAMAQAGIRYFSVAPNYFDRIGDILEVWENKPFYWVGPSGNDKVLVWIPYRGYALSHLINQLNDRTVHNYLKQLDESGFPYEIAYMRWAGHGDNAVPDPIICEFVKDWNERFAWPKFVISSTSEAFGAFEARYGDQLPEVSGDWTPYWEDGAGSSALETALNRNSSDRLSQAQALFALFDPEGYPVEEFTAAWRNVLLYSEHTWGAWCSVSDPDHPFSQDQWEIKKGYAEAADEASRKLLREAKGESKRSVDPDLSGRREAKGERRETRGERRISVVNTCSWERSGLVTLDDEVMSRLKWGKDKIAGLKDESGLVSPVQLLSDSSLVFYAEHIPAFASKTYKLVRRKKEAQEASWVVAGMLRNEKVMVHVDPMSGNISYLGPTDYNFVDARHPHGFNAYLFFEGSDGSAAETQGAISIRVKENGPIVKSLEIRSDAPGAHKLIREVSIIGDQNFVEVVNTIDKKRAPAPKQLRFWPEAQNENKESVNLAFPFHLPDGVMRLDLPLGEMIPWKDQLPSGCKNWFTVGRYVDISNEQHGVTWVSLDAPLIEVGELSANLLGSQTNPSVWRKQVEPTQAFYSWVMNNHWGTNYRQYQEGPVEFRYAIKPHEKYDAAEASRFATGLSQPLLAIAGELGGVGFPAINWPNEDVLAVAIEPLPDTNAWSITVYNPTDQEQSFDLTEPMVIGAKAVQQLVFYAAKRYNNNQEHSCTSMRREATSVHVICRLLFCAESKGFRRGGSRPGRLWFRHLHQHKVDNHRTAGVFFRGRWKGN